ncbi:MAG: ankyrin repeat domain-containing protein, partial [Treponema sp.]|nr:ankyrin repeat domain-containing protein [Treponema sp.]
EKPLLSGQLGSATHILVVFSRFTAGSSWFAYVAGFALGKGIPLLAWGADAGKVEPVFSKYLIPLRDEAVLSAYFSGEKVRQPPSYKEAKLSLLEQGIPFTVEALEGCISGGKTAAVELFLQAGFSPDTRNSAGVPLLCLAARAGSRSIVTALLKAGAQVNLQALDRGSTALIDSVAQKQRDIMADLLAAGADVNLKNKNGQTAIILAVGYNDAVCTEMLLKAGAKVDEPDSLGASARKYADLFKQPAILKLFDKYAC